MLSYSPVPSLSVPLSGEDDAGTVAAVDPYELLEAVEILSKMPKDFFEKIVSLFNYADDSVNSPSLLLGCLLRYPKTSSDLLSLGSTTQTCRSGKMISVQCVTFWNEAFEP